MSDKGRPLPTAAHTQPRPAHLIPQHTSTDLVQPCQQTEAALQETPPQSQGAAYRLPGRLCEPWPLGTPGHPRGIPRCEPPQTWSQSAPPQQRHACGQPVPLHPRRLWPLPFWQALVSAPRGPSEIQARGLRSRARSGPSAGGSGAVYQASVLLGLRVRCGLLQATPCQGCRR